jgi:hypothetical protein
MTGEDAGTAMYESSGRTSMLIQVRLSDYDRGRGSRADGQATTI